jgi:hypothetical protein
MIQAISSQNNQATKAGTVVQITRGGRDVGMLRAYGDERLQPVPVLYDIDRV